MSRLIQVVMVFSICNGIYESEWNVLKVKWGGFDCHSKAGYYDLPRTEREAKLAGFEILSDCEDRSLPWVGRRYAQHDDHGVVVIYDVNGYIAGIQSGIDVTDFPPASQVNHPFVKYDNKYYITFYSVKPEIICNQGRHGVLSEKSRTETHLFIQNGSSITDVEEIPLLESDLLDTLWMKTSCKPTIGQHYRRTATKDTDCDALSPLFLAYTSGKLGCFGWVILADANSTYFEHELVPHSKYTPNCMYKYGGEMTSLHIYLTSPCKCHC